jgi:hypothetical protein
MSDEIKVNLDGRRGTVPRAAYIAAKTKQLREFGYADLSEKAVADQLDLVLAGKKVGTGLDVIGGFIEGDIDLGPTPAPAMTKASVKAKARVQARRRLK